MSALITQILLEVIIWERTTIAIISAKLNNDELKNPRYITELINYMESQGYISDTSLIGSNYILFIQRNITILN